MMTDQSQDPLAFNPYAVRSEIPDSISEHVEGTKESIRYMHLNHEASLQSFGTLLMISATLILLVGVKLLSKGLSSANNPTMTGVSCVLIGCLLFLSARGLWKLNLFGKTGGTVFAMLGLIIFPVGTLINGYYLYMIWSKKGRYVFSPEYRLVIDSTPNIKYRTSMIVKVLAIMLIALFAFGIIASFVASL